MKADDHERPRPRVPSRVSQRSDAGLLPASMDIDAARGPVLWALLSLCAMCSGLVAYRWATGTPDPFVNVVLLSSILWTAALGAAKGGLRHFLLIASPYFTAALALTTLAVLQIVGDPLDARHTNALLSAYLALPLSYLLFFLLRGPREALIGAAMTCAVAVGLQAALPTAVAGRFTTGGWVAALTSIFQGALILLFYSVPRLKADRDLLSAVLQSSRDAVILLLPGSGRRRGPNRRPDAAMPVFTVSLANEAASRMFGVVAGANLSTSRPLTEATELRERLSEAHGSGQEVRFSASLRTLTGDLWFRVTAKPFRGGLVVSFADITEHKEDETRALELAHTDPLTGLANRRGFDAEAVHRIEEADEVALCYLDLDGFKSVNDRLGHEAGDELLRQVARRLRAAVRTGDLVSRVGGDEFVILVEGLTEESVEPYFTRVNKAFVQPFAIAGSTVAIDASLGVATGVSELKSGLATADTAMYRAKSRGGGVVVTRG